MLIGYLFKSPLLFRYILLFVILLVTLSSCVGYKAQKTANEHKQSPVNVDSKLPEPNYQKAARINAQLAIEYIDAGLMDMGKRKLLKARQQDSSLPKVHYALGLYYQNLGRARKAEASFKRALSLAPDNTEALNQYAHFLCRQGDIEQSKRLFKRSLALLRNDQLGITYKLYALCLLKQKNAVDKAQSLFKKALKQNPGLSQPYLQLARIHTQKKQYDKANQMLKKYFDVARPTRQTLKLALQIAKHLNQKNKAATLRLLLNSDHIPKRYSQDIIE